MFCDVQSVRKGKRYDCSFLLDGIARGKDTIYILLLSGKILRTGFSVQQFPICASRGFLTLMAAKAINGH